MRRRRRRLVTTRERIAKHFASELVLPASQPFVRKRHRGLRVSRSESGPRGIHTKPTLSNPTFSLLSLGPFGSVATQRVHLATQSVNMTTYGRPDCPE